MEYFVFQFQYFLLVLIRIMAMFAAAPVFSSMAVPIQIKIILSFFITLIIFPMVSTHAPQIPENIIYYAVQIINEIVIGVIIGFIAQIIFTAFSMAGEFFSMQMGLSINTVLDPLSQISIPLIGQFQTLIATMVFFAINAHHLLIQAVYDSFRILPVLNYSEKSGLLAKNVIEIFSVMFVIALKLSIPVLGTLFLVSIGMGILAKVAPQMNIMMLGFPINISIGFLMMMFIMPFFLTNSVEVIRNSIEDIYKLLKMLR